MTFWLVLLAAFLMWTMWICAFMHQMYPLARATTSKPVYKIKCFDDAMCKHVSQATCTDRLFGYEWDPVKMECNPKAI